MSKKLILIGRSAFWLLNLPEGKVFPVHCNHMYSSSYEKWRTGEMSTPPLLPPPGTPEPQAHQSLTSSGPCPRHGTHPMTSPTKQHNFQVRMTTALFAHTVPCTSDMELPLFHRALSLYAPVSSSKHKAPWSLIHLCAPAQAELLRHCRFVINTCWKSSDSQKLHHYIRK